MSRVGIVLLAVFVGAVAIEHGLQSDLDPASHMVSEYANGSAGWLMNLGFGAWSASLALTAAVALGVEPRSRRHNAVVFLVCSAAVGATLVTGFATQTSAGVLPEGVTRSTAGRLHDVGGGLVALGLFGAAGLSCLGQWPRRFRSVTGFVLVVAVVCDAMLVAVGPSVGGVRQRLLILAGCGWQLGVLVLAQRLESTGSSRAATRGARSMSR